MSSVLNQVVMILFWSSIMTFNETIHVATPELYLYLLGSFLVGLPPGILGIAVGGNKDTSCPGVVRAELWSFVKVCITLWRVDQYLSPAPISIAMLGRMMDPCNICCVLSLSNNEFVKPFQRMGPYCGHLHEWPRWCDQHLRFVSRVSCIKEGWPLWQSVVFWVADQRFSCLSNSLSQ